MVSEPPKVFISYSHDSPEHVQRLLRLANRLREDGIDCMIDQYVVVPENGWRLWTERQIEASDFVLMVCTETYFRRVRGDDEEFGKGLGVRWEGRLIYRALYRDRGSNTKFIPVLFETSDSLHIPGPVLDTNFYLFQTEEEYEDLYRRLTNQPRINKPKLGQRRSLPSHERKSEGTSNQTKGSVGEPTRALLHPKQSITEVQNLQTTIQQPMPTDFKARIFVSHSSKDKPFVGKLVEALKKHLLDIWVDEHEIKVGDSLVGKISEALKDADYLVIVLSQASVSSRWVEQELNAALTNQISGKGVVLPVLLEDCELPMLLRDRLYADFRADFDVGLQALLAAFEHEGESTVDVGASEPTTAAPASITPTRLRENLQGLLSDRMSRTEVSRLWYAVLETRMEDEMGQRPKSDCVIELLEQAKNRNKLPRLTEELRKIRPDLSDP
jgi:TIR domain